MAIRKINPTSPGQRGMTKTDFAEITTQTPEKSLLCPKKKTGGRNNTGRITTRHIGGGHKRKYRMIDYKREKFGIIGFIKTIEYDPNRNVRISLVVYADGEKRYILTPEGLNVGDTIVSGHDADVKTGNALPLDMIPLGTMIHNIELIPGRGAKLVRAAGDAAQLMAKEGDYVTIKLPSTEMRMVRKECLATIGVLGNQEFKNLSLGKAGRKRYLGVKPTVRGVTMNPVDHPHLGQKTRNAKKASSKLIVRRRKK